LSEGGHGSADMALGGGGARGGCCDCVQAACLRSQVATPHSRVAMALRTRAAAYSDPAQGSGDLALLTDNGLAPLASACSFSLRGGYDGGRSRAMAALREREWKGEGHWIVNPLDTMRADEHLSILAGSPCKARVFCFVFLADAYW
jgi:hypothetical protein